MRTKPTLFSKSAVLWLIGIISISYCYSNPGENFINRHNLKKEVRIVIFHINDIHGEIANFAKIASVISRERENCSNVLFMNAGDNFSGNPYVDRYVPKGEPILELLNQIGCDVQVLGNHEFDYGQKVLAGYMSRARFDIICANVNIKRGPIPQPKPFVVFETAEGIKIAVLGLLQISRATGMPDSNPENIKGIRFEAEIETARRYRYLKKANDVFIALTHMGYEKDKKLARELGELDVIIGGHSHTIIEEPGVTNGVLIVQTGSKNRYLGKIELVLKDGRLAGKTARLIELKTLKEEDPRVVRMIDRYTDNPELNRVIARFGKALEGKDEIGNLMTDAIRIGLELDLAFYNSGGIRLHFLNKTVRLKDIYALDPFDNEIIIFEMNPSEIRSLIRFDYENIKPLDLKVSGIQCKIIATSDRKVVSIELRTRDGFLLDENRFYTVGMNNYMASVYHFNHRDPGHSSYRKVVDLLISYLQKSVDIYLVKQEKRMFEKIIPVDN